MIKWTPKAQNDLNNILDHIGRNFSYELADTKINGLIDYVENTLSANPLAGLLVESNPFFSKLVYEGNSIFYCENPRDKNIYIVYVRARGELEDRERIA